MPSEPRRPFLWMTVFFIAMAFLESAVVVYLRALYYPDGFELDVMPMSAELLRTEILRELATMIMLLAPAAMVTRSALERFAWFCFGFGIWDIFYYLWLKVLLDWPMSLDTLDLLFLLPVPWVGPVWAPCLVSLGLIVLAITILRKRRSFKAREWILMLTGATMIVLSFASAGLPKQDPCLSCALGWTDTLGYRVMGFLFGFTVSALGWALYCRRNKGA